MKKLILLFLLIASPLFAQSWYNDTLTYGWWHGAKIDTAYLNMSQIGSGGGGSGTVTSVGFTGSTGIIVTGTNPITSSGTAIFTFDSAGAWSKLNLGTAANHAASYFEPAISAGTSSQYWRGDKTWQTLNAAAVSGLGTLATQNGTFSGTSSGTNTGDITLSGENYLSLSAQVLTVNAVNLSGTNVTGTLAAGRFPSLSGDVTTSAGSLSTTIAANAVTYAKIQAVSTTSKLIGSSASTTTVQEITLGTNLSMTGTTLNAASQGAGTGFFGDGSDSSLNYDGTTTILGMAPAASVYTLTRDIFASSITIHPSVIIKPNGYRIYCSGTLLDSGTIQYNGKDATNNSAGGAGNSSGFFACGWGVAGGGGGSIGAGSNGSGVTNAIGGAGGTGGISGAGQVGGTAGTQSANFYGGAQAFRQYTFVSTGTLIGQGAMLTIQGGAGGSGGGGAQSNSGGGGGGGGGVMVINAYAIVNTGTISANGGQGGNGTGTNAGSGGGGGGGGVLVTCHTYTGNYPTATGGLKGASKTGTGVLGTNGSDGHVDILYL